MLSYAPLVKKASPAVVNIYTKKKVQVQSNFSPFLNDPIFQHFFGGQGFPGGQVKERVVSSLGSGVIVKSNGVIITNNHVIKGSDDIRVVLSDRREFEAKVQLQDEQTDLALLKIDVGDAPLPFLELMDSDKLEVGDIVVAIGNPFGVGQTVTSGIVSALARTTVGVSDYQFFIQTDAAINPGNSGGALINMEGKLAGLNTAIFTKSGGSNGIGFAIPSNMVKTVVNSNGISVVRPWLGVSVQPVTQDIAQSLGMEAPMGAILAEIHPTSPAAKAGLKVGDVVVAVDSHEIQDEHALHFHIATYAIGQKATFYVFRNGQRVPVEVEMVAPLEEPKRDLRSIEGNNILSGVTVGNLSPALAEELGIHIMSEGVIIIQMKQKSLALRAGFRPGDIIKAVNGKKVDSTKELAALLEKDVGGWQITIQRGEREMNIVWKLR